MKVNGVKIKINTVEGGAGDGGTDETGDVFGQTEESLIQDYFDKYFEENSTDGTESTKSSKPIDGYFKGMNVTGEDPYGTGTYSWLEDFPPSVDELIASQENAVAYLEDLKNKYDKAMKDLFTLKESYEAALKAGGLGAADIQTLNQRLALVETAIGKTEQELANLEKLSTQMDNLWSQEFVTGKDLNNDNWLGKPFAKDSLLIQQNEDGTITYIDATSKKAVPCPIRDPEYVPQITTDNSLKIIDAKDAANFDDSITEKDGKYVNKDGRVDLYLQLTEEAISGMGDRRFNVACDLGVPQYLWVERNQNPDSSEQYNIVDDESAGDSMVMAGTWNTDGGLHQVPPKDLKKYVQVDVTRIDIRSVPTGLTDVNNSDKEQNQVYNHYIEFYNGTTLIGRMRIEGFEDDNPLATQTEIGSYVGASSASFALNGDRRKSEIEVNCGGMISTGRHIMDEATLKEIVGDEPNSEQGKRAYHETFDCFTEKNYVTQYFDGDTGTWVDNIDNDFTNLYDSSDPYGDCFVPSDKHPGENDTALEFRTGIFIDGLRGSVQGTGYNDIIVTPGVNEQNDWQKEHTVKKAEDIKKGDTFYQNIVEAQGGNNVVVAGKGDNIITDASFVKIDAGSQDDNIITTPEILDLGLGEHEIRGRNPKNYLNVTGGATTLIDLPSEFDSSVYSSEDTSDEGKKSVEKWDKSYVDDFINVTSASVGFSSKPLEGEYVGSAKESALHKMNKDQAMRDANDAKNAILDELEKLPDADEATVDATWQEVMDQKTSLDDEMNGFFNEMFGELDSLMNEENDGSAGEDPFKE
jgi:hypothetical protein